MVDLVYYLTNLLFFEILLLYYHIDLESSITFSLSSGDIHLSLGIYFSCSFATVSDVVNFRIKSLVASAELPFLKKF